jgi:hypothetical protein
MICHRTSHAGRGCAVQGGQMGKESTLTVAYPLKLQQLESWLTELAEVFCTHKEQADAFIVLA